MSAINQLKTVLAAMLFCCLSAAFAQSNSASAHLCKADLTDLHSSTTGALFSNVGECVSFAAQGGTLSSIQVTSTPVVPIVNIGGSPEFTLSMAGFGLAPGTTVTLFACI